MYSDRRNFVITERELGTQSFTGNSRTFMILYVRVQWHFNPPLSRSSGGSWEVLAFYKQPTVVSAFATAASALNFIVS